MADFHFLRPLWLCALLILIPIVYAFLRQKQTGGQWQKYINPALLKHINIETKQSQSLTYLFTCSILTVAVSCLSLAGPTWEKSPSPTTDSQSSLVIVLDQSLSMLAQDIKPSRNEMAKRKIQDIIKLNRYKNIGLIVYAGTANTVVPITDDHATLLNFLPAISPIIMPALGSQALQGIKLANELIRNVGMGEARILLITDGISANQIDSLATYAQTTPISILQIGTKTGAPIPLPEQGYLKDKNGEIIVAHVNMQPFSQLASISDFRVDKLSVNDDDVKYLVPLPSNIGNNTQQTENEYDTWVEYGYYLIFILIPICLIHFRKGLFFTAQILLCAIFSPTDSYATTEQSIFLNDNQNAHKAYESGDFDTAKKIFNDRSWRGLSALNAKQYESAIDILKETNTSTDQYNLGLAYAGAQKYDQAIEAFEHALSLDPTLEAAQKNIKTIQDFIDQQQASQNQDQNSESAENDQNQQNSQSQENAKQDQASDAKKPKEQQPQSDSSPENEQKDENEADKQDQENNRPKEDSLSEKEEDTIEKNEEDDKQRNARQAEEDEQSQEQSEKNQAIMKQLREVDEDPSSLLKNKFQYQYNKNRQQNKSDDQIW